MHIIVASHNPVKMQCVKSAFLKMFPAENADLEGVSVASRVSDQPMSDEETLQGAFNRAASVKIVRKDADFWVGLEGGLEEKEDGMECFAWAVVMGKNAIGKARTAAFLLPPKIAELVKAGYELSDADDIVFNRKNSKHQNGAVGLLTGDVIDRAKYYEHALILALIPFKNMELYGKA